MANNKMKIFTATKQIESITIHYNEKLDGSFVRQLEEYIVNAAKKISGMDLKAPKETKTVNVFIYPDPRMFNRIFYSAIEKRYVNGQRELGDLHIVRDDDGNIHMASPRGKGKDKIDMLCKTLAAKILSEYMEENQRQNLKAAVEMVYKDKKMAIRREKEKKEQEEEEERERQEAEEKEELERQQREQEEEEARLEAEMEEERLRQEEEEREKLEFEMADIKDTEKEICQQEKELPSWIVLGWAGYFAGRLKNNSDKSKFRDYMQWRGYIKPKNVEKMSDQYFAIAQVEYIIQTYGFKKFKQVLRNPDEMYSILHVSKFNFNRAVKAHIFKNYTEGEMKLEVDQAVINESIKKEKTIDVTVIRTNNEGSYILPEDNEIKKIKE